MNNDTKSKFLRFNAEMINEIKNLVAEMVSLVKSEEIIINKSIPFIFATFSILMSFIIYVGSLIIILIYLGGKWVINKWKTYQCRINNINNVFNEYVVREILCTILKNDSGLLEIDTPKTVDDITPVKSMVKQMVNGYIFFHFIVHHPCNAGSDYTEKRTYINLKLAQHLQSYYSNYRIVYYDIPVVYVFKIAEDLYHNNCYGIDIMIIDSDEKYYFVQNQVLNLFEDSSENNIADEDF